MAAAPASKPHAGNDIKTQFCTKEGCYKSLKLSEYSRPSRLANNSPNNVPVRLSFISAVPPAPITDDDASAINHSSLDDEKVAFNVGRDMYFFVFTGTRKAPDLNQPIDRRTYKGSQPTCHDINLTTSTSHCVDLIIGFSAGQIQLMDPISHECKKCFNEERLVEKGPVTCVKWVPGSNSKFLVSYNNPKLYTYDINLPALMSEPQLQIVKQGNGYCIEVVKKEQTCNPICRWKVGQGGINEISFSPDNKYLAIVSQDGYLRVFDYQEGELIASMRSYFGGLLCCCWSPDGKYIVTGGEDDLITIYSHFDQHVIARGQGHKSWVNAVAFDPYACYVRENMNNCEDSITQNENNNEIVSYRIGSVGDDTLLLLWEIGEDILKPQKVRTRSRAATLQNQTSNNTIHPSWSYTAATLKHNGTSKNIHERHHTLTGSDLSNQINNMTSTPKYHTLNKFTSKYQSSVQAFTPLVERDDLILGSRICPRLSESETLEPLIAKKVALDRLSSLVFRKDCLVTATYEGFINVWARPNHTRENPSPPPTSNTIGQQSVGTSTPPSGSTLIQ